MGPYEFARPAALWGLLLALVLVLLHLYRRRRVVVPFLPLLVEAVGRRRAGGGFQKVREIASLVLRILALVALVLAFAGPRLAQGNKPTEALVVVIDGDPTTAAREDDGRTRRAHLFEAADAWLASRAWRWVAVLEAAEVPLVVQTPSDPAGVDALPGAADAPSPAPGDLPAAVALARELVARSPPARIVVLTARALALGASDGASGAAVEVRGVGRTRENQGLVQVDLEPLEERGRHALSLRLRNEAATARERVVVVSVGGEVVERRPVLLPAEGTEDVPFAVVAPRGGAWLDVHLEGGGPDAYAVDDAATLRLPDPARPSVLIVRDGGARPYTRAAIEAMADEVDLDHSGVVRPADLARATARDVMVSDGAVIPEGTQLEGAWLFLAPLGGDLPFHVGATVAEPLVWRTDVDHPLLADVDLRGATVARGQPVSGEGLHALAEAEGKPVLAEGERGGLRYVVLGLDPEASDLPVRAAFPLLIRNAIRRLALATEAPLPPFVRPLQVLRPTSPLPGGPDAVVRWEDQARDARLAPDLPGFRVPPGARGRVEVRTASGFVAHTAFVAVDDAARVAPVRAESPLPAARTARRDPSVRLRRALLTLGGLLLLLDLLLFAWMRRVIARGTGLPGAGLPGAGAGTGTGTGTQGAGTQGTGSLGKGSLGFGKLEA